MAAVKTSNSFSAIRPSVQNACARPPRATIAGSSPCVPLIRNSSTVYVGFSAARTGAPQVRPVRDAEQVNQALCAFGSKVVSYQQAQSTPVVVSTADAGKN